jgi:membrane protease YdiL (CAAX protease family)
MNHLESSFTGKNSFWRYLIMIVVVFAASNTIGAIPILLSIAARTASDPQTMEKLSANPGDLSSIGIDPNMGLIMMVFPFVVSLAAFAMLIKPLNERTLMQIINGTSNFRWNRFFISGLVWLIASSIYLIVNLKLDPSNFTLNNTSSTIITIAIISVLFIPLQAAFEEIVFRGYLMQGFSLLVKNRFFPLIMTSVMFGLMHVLNPEVKEFGFWRMMPQYILFGFIFGIITVLDDGIETAMGTHAANNVFISVMVTNKSSVLHNPSLYIQHNYYPFTDFVTMLIMGIIVVFVLKVIFKWKSFSVLFGKIAPLKAQTP